MPFFFILFNPQDPLGTQKSHAKVTKVAKVAKVAKVTKVTCENKKLPFYGIATGAGVRQKKNYKKDLRYSVNRDIMDSNKTSRISGKGGKRNHANCV